MALDHVKDGIRVNAVCPGTTMTPWIGERLKEAPDPEAAMGVPDATPTPTPAVT